MKYLLLFILSISSITQSSAINSGLVLRCDSLRLTDGRTVAVQITKQTNDRIFFTLCEDKSEKEEIILDRLLDSTIVEEKVIQKPAKSAKASSKENDTLSTKNILTNGIILVGIGIATHFVQKLGFRILKAIVSTFIDNLVEDISKIF